MRKLKIYVAGPYDAPASSTHDAPRRIHQNVERAIRLGLEIIERGHLPFIPHLTHYLHLASKKEISKEYWYKYDLAWLELCDAILYYDKSPGADQELAFAKAAGKQVFYDIKDIPPSGG